MLIERTSRGLYCPAGNFHIDPWHPVDYAIITHGHSDHARWGSKAYLTAKAGEKILRERLGPAALVQGLPFRETIQRNGVTVSLHPAGHILGSAQIRIEHRGEVCVVGGDYKTENDGLSGVFESLRCHMFVTESTFGLPIYRWKPQAEILTDINDWWSENQEKGRTSVLFAYALGKAQRILNGIDPSLGPVTLHGSVSRFIGPYEDAGARFPSITPIDHSRAVRGKALVIAPPSADHTPWLRKFGKISKAFASGWMQIRGARRRRALDRGFVLSDHADWNGLLETISATGAEKIWVTHGYTSVLARWLRENGCEAEEISTEFGEDAEDAGDGEVSAEKLVEGS
jgi:putative mRNA 3-end processing factor